MDLSLPWLKPNHPPATHQLLWRINNHYQRRLGKVLRSYDMRYIEYAIMTELLAQPRGVAFSYRQLAADLCVDPSAIARAVPQCISKHFLTHTGHDSLDERTWIVAARPYTVQMIDRVSAATQAITAEIDTMLSSESIAELHRLQKHGTTLPIPKAKALWWSMTHHASTGARCEKEKITPDWLH